MHKTKLYRSLKDKFNISQKTIDILDNELCEYKVKKGSNIVEQEKCIYDIIFLIEGVVLTTFVREGKEYVTNISFEDEIIAIPLKCTNISAATLIAFEDCRILKMKLSRFEQLMEEYIEFSILGYRICKNLLSLVAEEYFDYTGLEAKEAYDKLVRERPEVLNRIPLKHLASNLGVTPSSLSRIRAHGLSKNK